MKEPSAARANLQSSLRNRTHRKRPSTSTSLLQALSIASSCRLWDSKHTSTPIQRDQSQTKPDIRGSEGFWTVSYTASLPVVVPTMSGFELVVKSCFTWPSHAQTADVHGPEPRPAVELPILRNIGRSPPSLLLALCVRCPQSRASLR